MAQVVNHFHRNPAHIRLVDRAPQVAVQALPCLPMELRLQRGLLRLIRVAAVALKVVEQSSAQKFSTENVRRSG